MLGTKLIRKHLLFLPILIGLGLTFVLAAIFASPRPVSAQTPLVSQNSDRLAQAGNDACLGCHGKPGQMATLASGETLNLTIDADHYGVSVHGSRDITCVTCHTDISGFPHPAFAARDLRDVAIQMSATCEKCHSDKFQASTDSVHQTAMAAGNKNAAVCADCHEPHTQTQIVDANTKEILPAARAQIPQTCAKCHNTIFAEYKDSVHGAAVVGDGNPDVPTCTDCHGAHTISDPTTTQFRLSSPALCAKCHTDSNRMEKYGLSTQVMSTYVSDFHGSTVTLFQKQNPDQATNKPVCYDCHGVHNIVKVDDPQKGLAIKENLLQSCQKCHPDATVNFPASWMSHYIPSPSRTPLVYYVQLFYKILIPTVIGLMVLYVISDFVRRQVDRRKGGSHA